MNYTLRLTKNQCDHMNRALEFYARIGIGQLDEILSHPSIVNDSTKIPKIRRCIRNLKDLIFGFGPDTSHSIFSTAVPDAVRIVWDIRNVIRHRLAWDRAGNPPARLSSMVTVDFDEPVQSSQEPLPVIVNN